MSNWDKQQIITSYKQARNKAEQVTILAQLTETDNETIVMILEDAGVYEGAYKKCQQCGRDYAIKYKQGRTKWWIEEAMIQITAGYLMMARRKSNTHIESYLPSVKER